MTDVPRLATSARVEPRRLIVDGEEFPWFITEDGVTVCDLGGGLRRLTFAILVDGPIEFPSEAQP